MIEFTVPGQPVPNARHRTGKGHAYTPKRTSDYRKAVVEAAEAAGLEIPEGPVLMGLQCFYQSKNSVEGELLTGRPDLDNLVKNVKDALKDYWVDDAVVVGYLGFPYTGKFKTPDNPRAVVRIKPVPPCFLLDQG